MKITREIHDRCNAAFKAIEARDPELSTRALARGVWLTPGTPEHDLLLDMTALSDVASSFATGLRPATAKVNRAMSLIGHRA